MTPSPSPSPSPRAAAAVTLTPDLRVDRLVVPVVADAGHDRGVETAVSWARRWQLPITLLSVEGRDVATVDIASGEQLARMRERLAAANDVTVTDTVLAGTDVVSTLAGEVGEGDLVVMSTRAGDGNPATSHAWRLLQATGGPALLAGPAAAPDGLDADDPGPIVVGLDSSPLAEQSLEPAIGLATALGARVWLVQAVTDAVVGQVDELRARGEDVSASAYLRDTAAVLSTRADLAASHPDGQAVGWEVIQSNDAARAIASFAGDRRAAVIVLSSHGRSGLRAEVVGSTCMGVVAQAPAPVLVLVPADAGQEALGR